MSVGFPMLKHGVIIFRAKAHLIFVGSFPMLKHGVIGLSLLFSSIPKHWFIGEFNSSFITPSFRAEYDWYNESGL